MSIVRKEARHTWLLASLVVMELVNPLLAREMEGARLISMTLLLVAGVAIFWCAMDTMRQRWTGAVLVLPALVVEFLRGFLPRGLSDTLDVISDLSIAVFLAYVVSIIVRHIFGAGRLGIDDVVGAFAGYMMTGLLWGRLYALVWTLDPGAFTISPDIAWQLQHWHLRHSLFDFYSLANLVTVGYAGITTARPVANTLLWLEVMCGQFYMAVVVATIVGMKLAQALNARDIPDSGNR